MSRLALALASLAASSAVAALQPAGEVRNLALLWGNRLTWRG